MITYAKLSYLTEKSTSPFFRIQTQDLRQRLHLFISFTLKNVPDARRSKVSSEAYFCSMLSEEAAATTQQVGVFQRE